MRVWNWLLGRGWTDEKAPSPALNAFAKYEEIMRRENPDYDEDRRIRAENQRLEQRRAFLLEWERNATLRAEIAELERRAMHKEWADGS